MGSGESRCPRCGAAVPGNARFCAACGHATKRLSPGEVLDGKYEILDKVGEGGMGEVYRARHVHLEEIRIIKVTKPDALGEGDTRRFQEEARLATLVRHPNVAGLYDFSRLPDGSYYMVWEFIDGVTLEQRLRANGAMPVGAAVDVAQQVLSGLAEIHAQGIVHRDISPDNIMLRAAPGGRLQAKIIDLGIAKRVAAESPRMTGTGLFLGKLKYCSPEQAGGLPRGEALDGRSDLYSFGVVLYEMLSGRPPFEAETPEAYLGKHLHAPAPALDTRTLPPAAGPPLASILKRALEKDRARRYPTADTFRAALAGVEVGAAAPAEASRTTTTRTRLLPTERRSAATMAVVAIGLVLFAGVATYAMVHRRGPASAVPPRATAPAALPTAVPDPAEASPATESPTVEEAAGEARPAGRTVANPSEPAPVRAAAAPPRRPVPDARPPEDAAPRRAAEPPAPAPGEPDLPPGIQGEAPQRFRTFLKHWSHLPLERQARRSHEVVRWANRFVENYPDDPLSGELKTTLPGSLKGLALRSLDEGRPFLATLFYRAYRDLSFAPEDEEFERKFRQQHPPRDPGGR